MPFCYIVECADGSLYTGWTTDIERRVATHNSGKGAKYTRSRRPVRLVWSRQVDFKENAMSLERKIKAMTRKNKLEVIRQGS